MSMSMLCGQLVCDRPSDRGRPRGDDRPVAVVALRRVEHSGDQTLAAAEQALDQATAEEMVLTRARRFDEGFGV